MPRTKKYPDWVTSQRPAGHSIKEKDGKYYLYKAVSVYRSGRNPSVKNEYVGVITKDGIVYSKRKKVDVSSAPKVVEYGFSYVLRELAFDRFAQSFESEEAAENVFRLILKRHSQRSYLVHGETLPDPARLHVNVSCREKSLEKLIGMPLTDLYPLRGIFLVTAPGYKAISEIEPEADELLKKLGVRLHA